MDGVKGSPVPEGEGRRTGGRAVASSGCVAPPGRSLSGVPGTGGPGRSRGWTPTARSRRRAACVVARFGLWFSLLVGAAALTPTSPARADEAADWLKDAIRSDLGSSKPAAQIFALYLKAADAGLAEAQFDVAVLYDSGRLVGQDVAQAATWYARAATHGNQRAAYNLGQLYEAGQGVPLNPDLARAWFMACDLAAARGHLAAAHVGAPRGSTLSAPTPVVPSTEAATGPGMGGVELVWVSKPQPEPVHYFVELRSLTASGSTEVFSGSTDTSALLATVPDMRGDYAWRVLAVAREASRYRASEWQRFTVVSR